MGAAVDAKRTFTDQAVVFTHSGAQLSSDGFRMLAQQRQIAVGGAAGEQIDDIPSLQCREAADQVTTAGVPGSLMPFDCRGKMVGGVAKLRCGLHQQFETLFQPAWEPLPEIGVIQQGEQGRRQPDGDLWLACRISVRLFQGLQQRQVALEQSLEEPVFLKRSRLS